MDTLFVDTPKGEPLPSPTPSAQTKLADYVTDFLRERERISRTTHQGESATIRVSEVLGSIAHLYERIRNVVEYKGEHVLRRNAIERILKRLLWERSTHDNERLAYVLIRELIWARYLPNDRVPKNKTQSVAVIIGKYRLLLSKIIAAGSPITDSNLKSWIWGVASSEIEETLDPTFREPFVRLMNQWFNKNFVWDDDTPQHEREVQIYLAIHRALTKSDEQIMRYHLLLKEFPTWASQNPELVDQLVSQFFRIYQEIEKHLEFPNRLGVYRLMQKQTAPFEIIRALVEKKSVELTQILPDPLRLEAEIREIAAAKYNQIRAKVRRGIVRSIIYIFVTKVIFALLIEIPYELWQFEHVRAIPLAINTLVPPALMTFIGLTIKAPDETNTQRLIERIRSIVYAGYAPAPTRFSLSQGVKKTTLANIFAVIYTFLFFIIFGSITYLLLRLNFTVIGVMIFFAFLSLVLLFGFRVRFTAQELKVTKTSEGIFGYLFSNLSLPFLSTGVYLSKGLAKINVFTIILDFLIEAPLKTVIEVFEEWTSFIREKREEVVEVPQ